MSERYDLPPFSAPYAPSDAQSAAGLLALAPPADLRAHAAKTARDLIHAMRGQQGWIGGVEEFLHEFSLSSREGLAIMTLAESLLRVPDDATLDVLIADRLRAGDFEHHHSDSESVLVQAFAFALGVSAQLIGEEETPRSIVADLARRLGAPALRTAARQAMRLMGAHFVYGETIEDALDRAADVTGGERHSFDMLGEGARTAKDAARYFEAYAHAIETIGAQASGALPDRAGVSIKLSALHPRYEAISRDRVLEELTPQVLELARRAKAHDLVFTIDAEEADRLELSLDIIDRVVADPFLADWDGFGLAVQAYQKRAVAVIDHVAALAEAHRRRLTVRLVKGAYWDSEIKRAQERGLAGYPVFTRKAMTDVSFIACAQKLFAADRLYPQFATHNASSVATVLALAGGRRDYEFQRLHGMGDALYEALRARTDIACRIYAPVGAHRDLLAYLVRRLIENGANSSFVARAADPQTPEAALVADPFEIVSGPAKARHPRLRLPADIYQPLRGNSQGVEFGHRASLAQLVAEISRWRRLHVDAAPSQRLHAPPRILSSPIDGAQLGHVIDATPDLAVSAVLAAQRAFPAWSATPIEKRAIIIARAADFIETRRGRLIALLQSEGGKTLDDALAELREAADLLRYYAAQARILCADTALPGPTGEDNRLRHIGRGVFICISPWNFPLAIYLGQIAAALVTGNTVVAKPAEQTPLIAQEAVTILHEAGVPTDALQFAPGDGAIGAALVAHEDVAGVVFTGSADVAQKINRALAAKQGPIGPLIAETGGVNAMIVDSTALLEQVTDDVLTSAFRSAGQRCSALRLLCLQEDIADAAIEMIVGATKALRIGDPREIGVHIGPVIDAEAKAKLDAYIARRQEEGRVIYAGAAPSHGAFVAPHIIRLDHARDLKEEIFGPILHVATWRAENFDALVDEIVASRYGLTIGLHSRIDSRIRAFAARAPAGNVYVNRNMIGAVVGSQPFGGFGLSGTGPKAGGPDYLRRFLREETVTINTAAMGGDATLMSLEDE